MQALCYSAAVWLGYMSLALSGSCVLPNFSDVACT